MVPEPRGSGGAASDSLALRGSYTVLQRNPESGFDDRLSPEFRGKVSAARFVSDAAVFMASDGGHARTVDPNEGDISLTLTVPDPTEAERVFDALCDGGHAKQAFGPSSWGGLFGIVRDRFATEWIVTTT
jgi:PhnB protein